MDSSTTTATPADASASPSEAEKDEIAVPVAKTTLAEEEEVVDEDDEAINGATHISFRSVTRVNVAVRNLAIHVQSGSTAASRWARRKTSKRREDEEAGDSANDEEDTRILDGVSTDMPAGQLMAIVGGSGSGKTSLLNVLAHRMKGANLHVTGITTFNGSPDLHSIRHAYVMQQDVLLPRLTVRETLRYSAELRLPPGTSAAEREQVVEEVILQLGLKECADTLIGDNEHKGCSGGEKRRVSIGVQLLANPSVLFLDEPTTGLDATSAFQLVRTLKNLALSGRTVVTTIHQPRSEIWGLFDRVTLLSRGHPIYSGRAERAVPYFEELGHPLPQHVNPADFLVDLSQTDYRTPEAEAASVTRVQVLVQAWREREPAMLVPTERSLETPAQAESSFKQGMSGSGSGQAPFWRQVQVLTRRTFKTTYRDPMGIVGCLTEAAAMGVIAGWIFFNIPGTLSGIRSREAALYLAASLQGYLILLFETYRLSVVDIHVFDREHGEGVISVTAFLLARRLAKMFTEDLWVPLLFSCIFYWMCGLTATATKFFIFFAIVLVGQYIAVSFATLAVAVSRDFSQAALFGNLSYTLQSLGCGYFIQSDSMPVYVRWTKYIAYNWYAVGALASNEFTDNFYDCPYPGGKNNSACEQYTGNFVLSSLAFPRNWKVLPICVNVAWAVFFYVVAGFLLRFFTVDITVSKQKNGVADDKDRSAGKEKIVERRDDAFRVTVELRKQKLSIHKPAILAIRPARDIQILRGVSARFDAGALNVIMGPSGSGKSSLLNLLAHRLHSSIGTRYRAEGSMLFNGSLASDAVVRSLCSYVTQDDDALLPSLTVRETLRFAAALRLPAHMTASQKRARAEEVLLKLGLKDCANTLIGSPTVKGISGGEKRRVSIAVQVLTEPRVLLLDEPTSGLDAFTAKSILSVLRGLADEGRTVVATIHQSRADLFQDFGNVLLLARGGHAVYSGPAMHMLPYFERLGYRCPPHTNPTDFAIDLITVDLQHAARERRSRIKVDSLVQRFSHVDALAASSHSSRELTQPAELGAMVRTPAPFRIAYPILVRRAWLNMTRQPAIAAARIMQAVGLGIIVTLFFAPLKNDYVAVQNRLGFLQEVLPLYFVGMLQNVALYPAERDVFYREEADGAYGVAAFFGAYTSLEVPFEVVAALVFAVLADMAVGLPRTASVFFVVAANALAIVSCGESVGIVFNTLVAHTGFSVNLTSTLLSLGVLMSGIMSIDMPAFLKGVNYLSPMKYAAANLAQYTLRGVRFTCTHAQRQAAGGQCPVSTGEDALELFGMRGQSGWKNLVALGACAVIYRAVAFAVLKVKRTGWGVEGLRRRGKAGGEVVEEKGPVGREGAERALEGR